jgi:hypothetical protein
MLPVTYDLKPLTFRCWPENAGNQGLIDRYFRRVVQPPSIAKTVDQASTGVGPVIGYRGSMGVHQAIDWNDGAKLHWLNWSCIILSRTIERSNVAGILKTRAKSQDRAAAVK